MILSGITLLIFVPLHIWTFKFGPNYDSVAEPGVRDLHRLMDEVFAEPLYVVWYVVALALLGYHAWHGFGSAFGSLGSSHSPALRRVGHVFAVLLAGGFIIIPITIYLGGGAQ